MACDYFDIGILRRDGRMLLREAWTATQIEQAIQRLRRENARGAHIFVRPRGTHALSLIDDLSIDAIARITDAGFQPALVIETSPQNFQVWLNHGRTLDRNMSTWAAKESAKRFRRRPLECGLETFRSTRRIYKSEAGKALSKWFGTVRSPSSVRGQDLRSGS